MRVLGYIAAVVGAAALTLLCMIALVQGTIAALAIESFSLRAVAIAADVLLGTILLVGCIYLATHLAVVLFGVGHAEFPAISVDEYSREVRSGDSAKI